jgi:hypothetical protein
MRSEPSLDNTSKGPDAVFCKSFVQKALREPIEPTTIALSTKLNERSTPGATLWAVAAHMVAECHQPLGPDHSSGPKAPTRTPATHFQGRPLSALLCDDVLRWTVGRRLPTKKSAAACTASMRREPLRLVICK